MNPFALSVRRQSGAPKRVSLRGCFFALVSIVLAAYLIVGWWSTQSVGPVGWRAAAIAALICGLSSTAALLLVGLIREPKASVAALLGGMLIRTIVPLGAGLFVSARGGPLRDAGFFGLIVVFYLVTLAAETVLSLKLIRTPQKEVEA